MNTVKHMFNYVQDYNYIMCNCAKELFEVMIVNVNSSYAIRPIVYVDASWVWRLGE